VKYELILFVPMPLMAWALAPNFWHPRKFQELQAVPRAVHIIHTDLLICSVNSRLMRSGTYNHVSYPSCGTEIGYAGNTITLFCTQQRTCQKRRKNTIWRQRFWTNSWNRRMSIVDEIARLLTNNRLWGVSGGGRKPHKGVTGGSQMISRHYF